MEQEVKINFPTLLGKLNENHKSDYVIHLCRTKCNLELLKRDDGAYGACGKYEYRIGGNNGQIDEDVVAAVVANISKIVYSTVKENDGASAPLNLKYVYSCGNVAQNGISYVDFKFELGDWFINFEFVGHLLEAEYVINVSKDS